MACLGLLEEARAAGLEVIADGDELVVRGPRRMAERIHILLAHKGEVLAELRDEQESGKAAPIAKQDVARPRRLIGNKFPPRPTPVPPAAIVAEPRVVCPICNQGTVLRELRELTGGNCIRAG